ncbi:MAG: hypothetical protein V2I35_11055 [Desulfocapsaceae bacterium]|jgi:hypothetical protein|nr:hypothetical protein [Desulfocapsaceae bacterium]
MVNSAEFETLLENEWYAVRHSGEIPEIALCSSLYYLAEDRSGPCRQLSAAQNRKLVEAAELRYKEIVLRDLQPANRGTRAYRGVKRSIVNWTRYETFCRRQRLDPISLRHETAAALLVFLAGETVDVQRGRRVSSINCSFSELRAFAERLGLDGSMLPRGTAEICTGQK